MIYGFDTDQPAAATAALLVYAIFRSRDKARYKVTPDMWGQIERFVKAAAKRAPTLPRFIEALKPRLYCDTIQPRHMEVGANGDIPMVTVRDETGALQYAIQPAGGERREFLAQVLNGTDQQRALDHLYRETAWIVLLVRDRLEREKPAEAIAENLGATP